MWKQSRETAPIILTDGTGVLILQKEKCRRGHFYVFIDVGRHVIFRYLKTNDSPSVAEQVASFSGLLQSDASSVYHELHRREQGITECGCWAHGRRNLFDALHRQAPRPSSASASSENSTRQTATPVAPTAPSTPSNARRLRSPCLRTCKSGCGKNDSSSTLAPPSSSPWATSSVSGSLTRFLEDGRIRLDNNPSELELRHEAVGRKNWLFCATDNGAEWNATVVSLIASCRMHDIEPWAYLRDVLTLLPVWLKSQVIELAPAFWRATLARPGNPAASRRTVPSGT